MSGLVYPTTTCSATEILDSLPGKFEKARKSGELFYFPSGAKDVVSDGKRFNIRCCPSLLDKQRAKIQALQAVGVERSDDQPNKRQRVDETKQNPSEPFKPPYVPELYVGCLEGLEGESGMSVLLNKYSVLPEHILLCPQTHEPQSLPPTPHQIALAYTILLAASRHPAKPRRMLAFYNGGVGAGASQSWRHIQLVDVVRPPVEDWFAGVKFERKDQPIIHPSLPYLHIIHPLPDHQQIPYPLSEEQAGYLVDELAPPLMKCFDLMFDSIRRGQGNKDGGWNLLMTLDHLHLIPRSAPSFPLPTGHEALELNSLGYAGMMLTRSEDEERTLLSSVEHTGGLMSVLQNCGVPRQWGEEALEAQNLHRDLHTLQ
ncbi:hypothetical protein M231_07447 [Tremella mesenterica]|uniref:Uncharacterized protein n=1 Tax=Tremella mesenterica TaxID=5217 RepID=A0A4Q1B960_TREME|nr:uncharacterized protein TREMEDRAFT_59334 [Tremella mesenterica DSM 1558]EIW73171.1 hypothetical protein TREMEDRAFT_59334 [Tremella mesenterica DSM 1558]RXK35308.1 hypothetical protein M231_07447 [Tremella mesenterica]